MCEIMINMYSRYKEMLLVDSSVEKFSLNCMRGRNKIFAHAQLPGRLLFFFPRTLISVIDPSLQTLDGSIEMAVLLKQTKQLHFNHRKFYLKFHKRNQHLILCFIPG